MKISNKIELKLLGTTELKDSDGQLAHAFLTGKKRLSLLLYLVLTHQAGFQRRDKLLAIFWPDMSQGEARNSLSNMLWHIRKDLGKNLLCCRGKDELMVDVSLVECDVLKFLACMGSKQYEEAIRFYGGRFLEGFFVSNSSPELEQWMENKREELHLAYLNALELRAAELVADGRHVPAAGLLKKRVAADPFETEAVAQLVKVLSISGNSRAGVKIAHEHAQLLEREFEEDGTQVFKKLMDGLEKESKPDSTRTLSIRTKTASAVAILPFEEMGMDPELSVFANGLHHDILTHLSANAGLKIISRTSMLRYRDTEKSVTQIADELGVLTIVEGGVQMLHGQTRVHVQVIDAQKDDHGVAETYDRQLKSNNFLEVQSELAAKISATIVSYIMPSKSQSVMAKRATDHPAAYRAYILGKRELDKRTQEGILKSRELFGDALELDGQFALAWLGLADSLSLLHDYGYARAQDCLPQAEQAIHKALAIDASLSDCYASLGLLQSNGRDLFLGIDSFLKAVELNPNCAEAWNWLSWNHQIIGQPGKALEFAQHAVELNPLYPEAVSNLSFSYLQNGFLEEGLLEAERCLDLEPNWATPRFYQAVAHYELGHYEKAEQLLQNLRVPWAGQGPLATLGLVYLALGKKDEALVIERQLAEEGYWFGAAILLMAMGHMEQAIGQISKVQQWDYWSSVAFFSLYPRLMKQLHDLPLSETIGKKVLGSWGRKG